MFYLFTLKTLFLCNIIPTLVSREVTADTKANYDIVFFIIIIPFSDSVALTRQKLRN